MPVLHYDVAQVPRNNFGIVAAVETPGHKVPKNTSYT